MHALCVTIRLPVEAKTQSFGFFEASDEGSGDFGGALNAFGEAGVVVGVGDGLDDCTPFICAERAFSAPLVLPLPERRFTSVARASDGPCVLTGVVWRVSPLRSDSINRLIAAGSLMFCVSAPGERFTAALTLSAATTLVCVTGPGVVSGTLGSSLLAFAPPGGITRRAEQLAPSCDTTL